MDFPRMDTAMSGESEYSLGFVVVASVILVLQFICGMVFNIAVLVVSVRSVKNSDERGNTFISNLNVVDVVMCLTAIPMTLTTVLTSRFKEPLFCFFLEGVISLVCVASSITLLMISLDRYYAVVTPAKRHVFTTKVNLFLALIWFLALFAFCTPFFGFNESKLASINTSLSCNEIMTLASPYFSHELFYVLTFGITTVGMGMFYVAILRVARRRLAIRAAIVTVSLSVQNRGRQEVAREQERKMLRLSMVIVVEFICLWGPHVIVTVVEMSIDGGLALEIAQLSCQILAYMTTIAHPLLYAFMRKKIRRAILDKLHRDNTVHPSTSSGGKCAPSRS